MKKILLTALSALLLSSATTSCVDSLDEYNVNPKAPEVVPAVTLFSNAQRDLVRTVNSASVNLNVFRLYTQYWAQTTYNDESRYDIQTRAINRTWWNTVYRDVLSDLNAARGILQADILMDEKVKANQLAEIAVLEVYAWTLLVDTFGDVPYSQAFDITNPQPKYDDDQAIYADLFRRLGVAMTQFDEDAESFGTGDLMYGGDVAAWKKFANSLMLRMAVTVADVPNFTATVGGMSKTAATLAQDAATNGVFTSSADNAQVTFLSAFPSTSPLYEDLVLSGRRDFVGADTFVDSLKSYSDPRLDEYFVKAPDSTEFMGGVYGSRNAYTKFSRPGLVFRNPTTPGVMQTYAEVELLLAEAVERGFAVGGTAVEHYDAGVTASIEDWGNDAADAVSYLAQPKVAYSSAPGDFKQKIGIQKWFALYNNSPEAWKEWRRLDSPRLVKPASALTEIPLRLTYPTTEQNLNTSNYNAASSAIGRDLVTSKIFWDKM